MAKPRIEFDSEIDEPLFSGKLWPAQRTRGEALGMLPPPPESNIARRERGILQQGMRQIAEIRKWEELQRDVEIGRQRAEMAAWEEEMSRARTREIVEARDLARVPGDTIRYIEPPPQSDMGIDAQRLKDVIMYSGRVWRKAEPPKPKVPDIQIAPPQPSRRIKFD